MTQVSDLIRMIRNRTDMMNDEFITDDELTDYINLSAGELDDLLVQTYDDYKLTSTQLTIETGNSVPLPSDYYKVRGVETIVNGIQPYTIRPYNFQERNNYYGNGFGTSGFPYNCFYRVADGYMTIEPLNNSPGTYTFFYTPTFVNFVSPADSLPAYMDVQSWHQYITLDVAIMVKTKTEEPEVAQTFMMLKEQMRQRILTMSKGRSQGEAKTMTRIRTRKGGGWGRGQGGGGFPW